jgi:hypothetical protein
MLGTSDLLWHSLQSSVGHSYGSFENAMKVIILGKETEMDVPENLHINLNKRNNALISKQ